MSRMKTIRVLCALLVAFAPMCGIAAETDSVPTWSWFGDGLLRAESINGIPRADDAFDRVWARGRFGAQFDPSPQWHFAISAKASKANNANDQDRRDNRNERSNAIGLDRLFLRWQATESAALTLGKTELPLDLTPLTWDRDLRPAGLSADVSTEVGEFNRLALVGGYFAGSHLYGDDSRIAAAQLAFHWREGAPLNASALVAYLDFSDLNQAALQGLTRTNRRLGAGLLSDYRLVDLQLVGRAHAGAWPLELRLDFVRNLGADNLRDGARASLVLGDMRQPHSWEFGFAAERIQRDAVMAAFNSDDWWFHSNMRGVMPWIGYGIDGTWSLRLAGFRERRDGVSEHTRRVLLDLNASFGGRP